MCIPTRPVVTRMKVKLVVVGVILFCCVCLLYTHRRFTNSWVSPLKCINLTSTLHPRPGVPPCKPPPNVILVTAAESNNFAHLLNLIDSFVKTNSGLRILVWNIGLRDCQVAYLQKKNLSVIADVRIFPFWLYPVHLKADVQAWKPVIIKKAVDEFGHALWVNPDFVIKGSLTPYLKSVIQHGFVALYDSPTCSSSFVGFSKDKMLAYKILQEWEKCAIDWSCIASADQASGNHTKWYNWFLTEHVLPTNYSCDLIDVLQTLGKESKRELEKELVTSCEQTAGCIITGDHRSPCYSSPQLKTNKVNYAKAHGYRLIFESESYAKRKEGGICNAVWGKMDALLKYIKECKTLLHIDDDGIFTNFTTTLESFFENPQTKSKDMIITQPTTDGMINAGVILMRSTEAVQRLVKEIFNGHSYCQVYPFEQGALWDVVRNKKWNKTVAVMNDDHSLQTLCGFQNGRCLWRPGDFIAHFAHPRCPKKEIEEFIKEHQGFVHV